MLEIEPGLESPPLIIMVYSHQMSFLVPEGCKDTNRLCPFVRYSFKEKGPPLYYLLFRCQTPHELSMENSQNLLVFLNGFFLYIEAN